MDIHLKSNNWDKEKEIDCTNIANKAEAFVWLYNETSQWYHKLNTIFTLIIVIGSYLFGSTGIPTLFTGSWSGSLYINLIIQILVIIIGIIGTIYKALNFTDKITKCNLAAFRYSILFLDIKKELNKDMKHRIDYDTFYEKISGEDLELKHEPVHIPDRIFARYHRKLESHALSYDALFLDHIEVKKENKSFEISSKDNNNSKKVMIFELEKYV